MIASLSFKLHMTINEVNATLKSHTQSPLSVVNDFWSNVDFGQMTRQKYIILVTFQNYPFKCR